MQSASVQDGFEVFFGVLAIRFVGVDRISTLDAVGEVDLVERRCRQRAVRCVELSNLKILDECKSGIIVGVESVAQAMRVARDVSGALSAIPPVAGIRVSVGCGFVGATSPAFDEDSRNALFARARAAAERALDDQLVMVETSPAANCGEETGEISSASMSVMELMPGIAVDHGVEVLHVAFNNQITNLYGSGQRLTIGRGDSADIRIAAPSVSREHGRISFGNGKAFFTDLSTNGSRLINADGESLLVKRQTVELGSGGQIIVGYANGAPSHPPIRYVISRARGNRPNREKEEIVVAFEDDFDGMTATRVL